MSLRQVHILGLIIASFFSVLFLLHFGVFGYVLQLDMIFGPESASAGLSSFIEQGSVYGLLIYIGSNIFGVELFQRVLVGGILFASIYIPYISLYYIYQKNEFGHILGYILGSILMACNPYVYSRLLAGQWGLVFGYILILPLISTLYSMHLGTRKKVLFLSLVLLLQVIFASHIAIISIFFVCAVLVYMKEYRQILHVCSYLLLAGIWFLPQKILYILRFDTGNGGVFFKSPTVLEAISFKGFWLESEPWVGNFFLPLRDMPNIILVMTAIILLSAMYAVYVQRRDTRVHLMVALYCISLLCTVYGSYIFAYVPLFDSIFRDTSKWQSVVVVLTVISFVHTYIHLKSRYTRYLLMLPPLFLVVTFSVGLLSSVHAYTFTKSVTEIRAELSQRKGCMVLVLPWYQYYTNVYMKDGEVVSLLTANPARHIYPCTVL
ncbi:MAG: hypothetical protein FGM57_00110 [Candidatus Taylorbacteria bacterium]|nr:hypothetical protein [Candidatus Taylorbacteria bacterium]